MGGNGEKGASQHHRLSVLSHGVGVSIPILDDLKATPAPIRPRIFFPVTWERLNDNWWRFAPRNNFELGGEKRSG
jgi:hypothetical protein